MSVDKIKVKDISDLEDILGLDEARNRMLKKVSDLREKDQRTKEKRIGIITSDQLDKLYPNENEIIIDPLIRRGEVFNIVSDSKAKKTWIRDHISLAVAFNLPIWMMHTVLPKARVLVIDNELHGGTLNKRRRWICERLGIDYNKINERISYMPLRGRLLSLEDICHELLSHITKGQFDLIFIDSLYKAIPQGFNEISNSDMTQLYNWIDNIALSLDCAIGIVHHNSKGRQGHKRSTDRGSGAGAISRAADTHLTLVEHHDDDHLIIEGPTRTFQDIDPFVVRWDFPIWVVTDKPIIYKDDEPEKGGQKTASGGRKSDLPLWEKTGEGSLDYRCCKFCQLFIAEDDFTLVREIKDNASKMGFSNLRIREYLRQAKGKSWIEETGSNKNANLSYKFLRRRAIQDLPGEERSKELKPGEDIKKESPPKKTGSATLWAGSPVETDLTEKIVLPTKLKRK